MMVSIAIAQTSCWSRIMVSICGVGQFMRVFV